MVTAFLLYDKNIKNKINNLITLTELERNPLLSILSRPNDYKKIFRILESTEDFTSVNFDGNKVYLKGDTRVELKMVDYYV